MTEDNKSESKRDPSKSSWGKGDKGLRAPRELGDEKEGNNEV